jgi:hypothetical protein
MYGRVLSGLAVVLVARAVGALVGYLWQADDHTGSLPAASANLRSREGGYGLACLRMYLLKRPVCRDVELQLHPLNDPRPHLL